MVAALDALEISFLVLVGAMTVLAGLFSVYLVINQFRNTGHRESRGRR